jgi:hypothetical protein
VRGLWALRARPEGVPLETALEWHAFLLLSVGGESKVLRTGEELDELQPSEADFALDAATVHAANLLQCTRILQARQPPWWAV